MAGKNEEILITSYGHMESPLPESQPRKESAEPLGSSGGIGTLQRQMFVVFAVLVAISVVILGGGVVAFNAHRRYETAVSKLSAAAALMKNHTRVSLSS